MRDQVHRIAVRASLPYTALAAATTGTPTGAGTTGSVDTLGYQSVTMIAQLQQFTAGTDTSFKLQDSPDNNTWTDLPGAQVIGGTNLVDLGAAVGIGLLGVVQCNRYIRAVVIATGGTVTQNVRADILLGNPLHSGSAV